MGPVQPTAAAAAQLRHEEELRLCRQTAETWRQEAIELFHRRESVATESPRSRVNPARFLVKQTAEDDIETYLQAFERTAQREEWPEEQWVSLLAPFLSGIAQTAYQDTAADSNTSYPMLKADILHRYGVSMITRAQRFHDWTYDVTVTPRAQIHDLLRLANGWLISEPVSLTPIERLVMDKFMRSLPYEARKTVCQQSPKTLDDVVTGMEGFLAVQAVIRGGRGTREEATRRPRERPAPRAPPGYPASTLEPTPRAPRLYAERRRCFDCGEEGHIARGCPHRADVSMPSAGEAAMGRPCGLLTACWAMDSGEATLTPVQANGRDVTALLDSGSSVTLVRPEFAGQPTQPDMVGVTCVHGETRQYPTTSLELGTVRGRCQGPAGVVENLPVAVLIGTDCPLFQALWDSLTDGRRRAPRGLDGPRPPAGRSRKARLCGLQEADPQASTEPMSEGESDVADPGEEEAGPSATPAGVVDPPSGEEEERAWEDLFPQDLTEEPPVMAPLRGTFGVAQLDDANLAHALQQVVIVDGKPLHEVGPLRFPYFAIKKTLLYRVVEKGGVAQEQLLVPRPHINSVLRLAHSHVLGAHLGVEKTLERIQARFYWPGMKRAVDDFCKSCPECQMVAPRPHVRNPLIPLPIISVPFSRIGMDLVGPLPRSARGHQYILVILDYATRYPEAIPLRTMASKGIARELLMLISRVGIPEEILTDQGTPFMSKVMRDLAGLLKIKQLRTSVYHPQTDGLVERFNRTLKSMLKKVMEADGRNWDQLLPYLMFSIREVPQASTGFSPFELLYGRRPRGMLDLARETWEQQPSPHRTLVEHVEEIQERMTTLWPIVREHMAAAQQAQSRVYNRGAQPREFAPGDKVLVLVPTSECKFLAKWHGPYEILTKVGPVNYKVRQPGRRPPVKIYHVNLLKRWVAREALCCVSPPQVPIKTEKTNVHMGEQLTIPQKQDLQEVVEGHRDVFSMEPGRTTSIQHHIVTERGQKVKLRPYRLPEARRAAVRDEVRNMLRAGVIVESNSGWCSPIVLVPKPDGTTRFCNDFRRLNAISKFDAYPMPRVDELIERLGKARFITTLDLTKGYWQVPLAPEDREKTAFATPEGLFHYTVLPFGLHGAPATFQRLMDQILRPHRAYAAAYLDDIVIHSEEWGTHLGQIKAVLRALRGAGLTANPKKCHLGLQDADYLGYTIGRGCVRPQTAKVEAIRRWPRPQTKKQVRTFIGLTSYYRRFVPHFSSTAAPLTDLTKGRLPEKVLWTEEAEEAFRLLKEKLCSEPVLATPDFK